MDYSRLSHQVLDVSLSIRRGDKIWINGWDHTAPLVSHLARECHKRGCEVVQTVQSEAAWLRSLKSGPIPNLQKLSRDQKDLLNEVDAYIFTLGPKHPIEWNKIPKNRRGLATIWLLEDNSLARKWRALASKRRIRMLGIEATLATSERAKALGMDFDAYAKSMYAGCLADSRRMARQAERLSTFLGTKAPVRITNPNGTDLRFNLDARPLEVSDGLVKEELTKKARPAFLPAGAVGTTVDEKSAEGTIVYDSPIRRWNGTIVGLKLEVVGGRITQSSALSGASAFASYLKGDGRDADRFAFVGLGLNPRLSFGYTQDDKVFGAIELNFGENKSRGGKNTGNRNFWGTVSKADVTIGNRQIMKSGKLSV